MRCGVQRLCSGVLLLVATIGGASTAPAALPGQALHREVSSPVVVTGAGGGLAVWVERSNGDADIRGQMIGANGQVQTFAVPFTIASGPGDQVAPAVTFVDGGYIVVWEDYRSDPVGDIFFNRVDFSGGVVDPSGQPLSAVPGVAERGPVLASAVNVGLAAWTKGPDNSSDIVARRFRIDVTPLGSTFPIAAAPRAQSSVALAQRGGVFLAVWTDRRSGTSSDIYGSRISSAGSVLDPAGIAVNVSSGNQQRPAVAPAGAGYLAVWETGSSTASDISATVITDAGVVRQPAGIAINRAAGAQTEPAVAPGPNGVSVVWTDRRAGHADLMGTTVRGSRVTSPMGRVVSGGQGDQFDPAAVRGDSDPIVVWSDNDLGSIRLFMGTTGADGGGLGAGQLARLSPMYATLYLQVDRRSVIAEFDRAVDLATISVDDFVVQSSTPAESIDGVTPVAGSGDRRFLVTIGGSLLDEGDEVHLVDGQPQDDLAEVLSADGRAQAVPTYTWVPPIPVPTVSMGAVMGTTTAYVTFSLPIDLATISTEDFTVASTSEAKSVENVTALDSTRRSFSITLDAAVEGGDVVALVDGVPADGSAEVLTDAGAKSPIASVTVSSDPPATASISALHGATSATVTFSAPIDPATITASDFQITRPVGPAPSPSAVVVVPGSNNTSFTLPVFWPFGPGDVVSLVDGPVADGLADITTATGSKVELTSTTVVADNVKPVISISAAQGRAFVVTFSEQVQPQLFGGFLPPGSNIDDLFRISQGTGASVPTYSGNAFVTCSGQRCVVQWTTGTALVPGNTVSVDAARFTDLAGNSNNPVTAVVIEDSTAPTVISADLRITHNGLDRIDIVQGGPRLTITALAPGDSGLSVEITSGTASAPSISFNEFTGLISLVRGTTPGANSPAALADLVNNHAQLPSLVTATASGTADLVTSFAFPLVGGTTIKDLALAFSEDVVGSNFNSLIVDADGNLVTLGDQSNVGFPAYWGANHLIAGVPTSLQEGVSKLIVGQVTDLSGNPITPGTVVTLT